MFALRRAAVKAAFLQPAKQLATFRPVSQPLQFQLEKQTVYRLLHQSSRCRAYEDRTAAQANGETGSIEPSEAELSQVKEESIDFSQEEYGSAAEEAQSAFGHMAEGARGMASAAEHAASGAASTYSRAFPPTQRNSAPRVISPSKILYIGNIFFEVTAPELEAEFSRFGEIMNSRIVTDSRGTSKGFGYVEFAEQDAADRALREMDLKVFQGRRMAVQYHVAREPRAERGGGFTRNPPSKTLFIGNMSYQMTDKDLNDLFREIRNVLDVRVAIDRRSGQPRGFAHADFSDVESAEKAKEILGEKIIFGRQLRIDFSSNRPEPPRDNDEASTDNSE